MRGLESCLLGKETGGGKLDLEGKGAVALSSWFRAESRCHPPPPPDSRVPREGEPGAGSLVPGDGEQRGLFWLKAGEVLRAQIPSSEGAGGWGPGLLDFEGRWWGWTPGSGGEGSWGPGSGVSMAEGSGAQTRAR